MVSSLLGKGAAGEGKGIASNRFALGIRSTPRRMHKSVFFFGKDAMLEEVRVLGNSGNRDAMRTIIFFKIKKIDVIRLG